MGIAYTREFLVAVYVSRFKGSVDEDTLATLETNAYAHYDKVGRDEFRKAASVTPEAIRKYREDNPGA